MIPPNARFIPWNLSVQQKPHTIDPNTRIWPISEWGSTCARGFVSNSRFARPGDQVIKRTNRDTTRKWIRSGA